MVTIYCVVDGSDAETGRGDNDQYYRRSPENPEIQMRRTSSLQNVMKDINTPKYKMPDRHGDVSLSFIPHHHMIRVMIVTNTTSTITS